MARGAPPPRGGERHEPAPTFIARAAALTGFYVALMTRLPDGVALTSFAREGEAREPFHTIDGRQRAIAPDARIELGAEGRRLLGFLEVDLGTMSHRRLRAKARTDQASGATLARPGLERALREAEAKRFDLLLVYRVDRLARSVRGLAQILESLDDAGVLFRSATEPSDTATSAGRMMVQMLGVFAEFEPSTSASRTSPSATRTSACFKRTSAR